MEHNFLRHSFWPAFVILEGYSSYLLGRQNPVQHFHQLWCSKMTISYFGIVQHLHVFYSLYASQLFRLQSTNHLVSVEMAISQDCCSRERMIDCFIDSAANVSMESLTGEH